MKKIIFGFIFSLSVFAFFTGCPVSNKTIIRYQKMEEKVDHPTSIEELKEAISKYEERVADIQLAHQQIAIWNKMLGTRYLDAKMYGEAMKCFQKALETYPDNQNLYYWVGVCAGYMAHQAMDYSGSGSTTTRMNYLKLAEDAYSRAIKIDDRFVRALYGLSVIYVFELGESQKAIPLLEKIMEIETKDFNAMFVLARAYYENYEFDKAVKMYDKIISLTKAADIIRAAEENKKQVLDASY